MTSSISSKNCSSYLRKCIYNTSRTDCCVPNLVPQERVLYNKEVQTRDVGEENDVDAAQAEAELRERILRERLAEVESAAAREKELDEESVRLEKEIEADIRGNPGVSLRTITLMRLPEPRPDGRRARDNPHRPRIC